MKVGDKIWNTYFMPRVSPRTLAVGSATIAEIEVEAGGYHTRYCVKLTYDCTDSVAAFGDECRKTEPKELWVLHGTPRDAIKEYIRQCADRVKTAQQDLNEAANLLWNVVGLVFEPEAGHAKGRQDQ